MRATEPNERAQNPRGVWVNVLRPLRSATARVAVVIAAVGFLLMRAWIHAAYFDGQPFDGPFQLFNSLDRLGAGQAPWRDFVVFHGVGVVYAHFGLYLSLGRDVFASEFGRQILSPLVWIAAMSALAYVLFRDKRMVWFPVVSFFALSCASNIELPINNPIVSQPGNSLMALRWCFPALCGAFLIGSFRSGSLSLRDAAIAGVLFGLAPWWSFEQGAYAVAAAAVVIGTWCASDGMVSARWSRLLVFITLCAVALWLAFSVSSGGDAQGLLKFVFSTIPRNQGWYYGAPPNGSISLNGITRVVILYVACVSVLLGALLWVRRSRLSEADRLRWTVGLGFLGGYAVLTGASLAGILSPSYLAPAMNAIIVAAIVLTFDWAQARPRTLLYCESLTVLLAFAAVGAAFVSEVPSLRQAMRAMRNEPLEISGTRPVGLHATLNPLIDRVRRAPDRTVFSTYRGLLDVAVASPPHGRADYIIHALGDDEREHYLRTFEQGRFNFVHTMKPTYMAYEEWLQDAHWDFYRVLLEKYAVVAESDFSLLWQRRSSKLALQTTACQKIEADPYGHWILPATARPVFLEITLDYRVADRLSAIPIVGGLPRYVLESKGLTNQLPLSLDPHHTRAAWLVRTGGAGWIAPRVYSVVPGPTLNVAQMVACEIAIPSDTLPAFAHLTVRERGQTP